MGDVFWGTFQYEIDGNISPMSAFEIKVPHKFKQTFGQINKCDPSLWERRHKEKFNVIS